MSETKLLHCKGSRAQTADCMTIIVVTRLGISLAANITTAVKYTLIYDIPTHVVSHVLSMWLVVTCSQLSVTH